MECVSAAFFLAIVDCSGSYKVYPHCLPDNNTAHEDLLPTCQEGRFKYCHFRLANLYNIPEARNFL
jgi:hypothetical protein